MTKDWPTTGIPTSDHSQDGVAEGFLDEVAREVGARPVAPPPQRERP